MTAEAQGAGPAPHAGTGPLFHTRARALTAGDVTTAETIGGVSIALRRSPARFVGVLAGELSEDPSKSEIAILCDNGDTLPLAVEGDIDVVAEWRAASRRFGLPMIIQRPDGGVIALEAMLGPVLLGKAQSGRRLKALTRHRRPRFLTRRATTRLPLAPVIHRCGDGVVQR
ncbi:MAG: hypothetical protein BGP06_16600 [Rhizobiales bacterium 65-9]|nr:hypothetical protein [Hyphomicrobiales bacterium]OJY38075.1 MAG: hypothetical protein BGP06_16600 [Rhizobiales bacterium 65-9]